MSSRHKGAYTVAVELTALSRNGLRNSSWHLLELLEAGQKRFRYRSINIYSIFVLNNIGSSISHLIFHLNTILRIILPSLRIDNKSKLLIRIYFLARETWPGVAY